ncbi:NAD(P)/FAD-dependent oxidoreductase [Nocardia sp. NPDC050713]|uniref:flavin-containing monooxygenase n=1 Tax=Nocardia sp. NPDC050713 TaxID=3154511 RepID=UPI0033D4806B
MSDSIDFDAVVIGAGFGGLRALHDLTQMGLSTVLLEAGTDVGGVWYWNRYPGARTDSEAWYYCYSFSKEVLTEWDWSQRYPTQAEMSRYFQFVADRLDLRKHIRFQTRLTSAVWDESAKVWKVQTDDGQSLTCRYLVSAAGPLSKPFLPDIPGLNSFTGEWYQTAFWPKHNIDFTGKRVAVIGTGASGVQVVPVVALSAAEVTVFQRTPNYVLPARNRPLDEAERAAIKADYENIWARARRQFYAMDLPVCEQSAADFSPADQQRVLERAWEVGGFRFLFDTFNDLWLDGEANEIASEFIRSKIRAIVKDPATAELLCPQYPLAAKRPPCGHGYYEAYNRDNVSLVDVSKNPITEILPTGLRTATDVYEADVIIFATGFDAITGPAQGVDIRGRDGRRLSEVWETVPRSYLGMAVDGFPNMFTVAGPLGPFANGPTMVEGQVEWVTSAISHMRRRGAVALEPIPDAVDSWVRHAEEILEGTVLANAATANSWFLGANIPGKPRGILAYFGGAGTYFDRLESEVESDFPGFAFTAQAETAQQAVAVNS